MRGRPLHEKAVFNFLDNYYKALKRKDVKKPVSWALYQTWLAFDKLEKEIVNND